MAFRAILGTALAMASGVVVWAVVAKDTVAATQPVSCRSQTIAGARYRVCEVPAAELQRLQLVARDGRGRPVRTIARVDSLVRARGERLLFATNAGLYERVDSATGMLVADGRMYSRLNRGAGPANPCAVANFYCPPNGVFFVAGERAAVLSTADFARRAGAPPRIATQSGPVLVRRGQLARAFPAESRSRLVRNGVGVRADGTVVFAIADRGVTFHAFATAFRDALRCPDALFLDGTISQLYTGPGSRLPPPIREFAAVFAITERRSGRNRGAVAARRGALSPARPFARSSRRMATPPPNCGGGVVGLTSRIDDRHLSASAGAPHPDPPPQTARGRENGNDLRKRR